MGVWGSGPTENDTAADFCYDVDEVPLPTLVEKGLRSKDNDEIRIAAFMLGLVGINYVYPLEKLDVHYNLAIDKLREVLADSEWILEWNDPSEVREDIEMYIAEFKSRLARV